MALSRSGTKLGVQIDNAFGMAFENFFDQAVEGLDRRQDRVLTALNERILSNTPVWEGETILNWRWSTRRPDTGFERARGQGIDPGPTNTMALGEEPRRKINEERPRRSLAAALKAREPVDIFLTNTSDSAVGLEYGLLPTPQTSRSPKGIVRLAVAEMRAGIFG
jgi:hypothetical protein